MKTQPRRAGRPPDGADGPAGRHDPMPLDDYRRIRRSVLIVTVVLAAVLGSLTVWRVVTGLADRRARAELRERLKNAPVITPVETHEVYCRDIDLTVEAVGDVIAYRTVTVSAEVAGRLTSVDFEEGHTVAPRTVLATCDKVALELAVAEADARLAGAQANLEKMKRLTRPEEIAAAQAAVARAKAVRDEAATQYQRDERLFGDKVIGKAAYDASLARYQAAEADYRNAQERLRLLEAGARPEDIQAAEAQVNQWQAALAAARDRAAKAAIRAPEPQPSPSPPTAGQMVWTVADKHAETGQYVTVGAPIATLIETDRVKIRLFVSEMDVGRLRRGMSATVRVDALSGDTFPGTVSTIAPRGDPGTRTFRIEVMVLNPDGRLRPEMIARVEIVVTHLTEQMVVPTNSVITRNGETFVFVARGTGVERRKVKVLRQVGDQYVVNGDLECGDQAITLGREVLTESSQIRVITLHAAPAAARRAAATQAGTPSGAGDQR